MTEPRAVVIEPAPKAGYEKTRGLVRRSVDHVTLEKPIKGLIVDLSESGLGVESHEPLQVLSRYVFRLRTGNARPEFRGEVRWCRLDSVRSHNGEATPVYRSGVALLER